MKAINFEGATAPCCDECLLTPEVTYSYVALTKTLTITDTSTYDSGDSANVINFSITDVIGETHHAQLSPDGAIVLPAELETAENLSITVTVASTNNCQATIGTKTINLVNSLTGTIKNI